METKIRAASTMAATMAAEAVATTVSKASVHGRRGPYFIRRRRESRTSHLISLRWIKIAFGVAGVMMQNYRCQSAAVGTSKASSDFAFHAISSLVSLGNGRPLRVAVPRCAAGIDERRYSKSRGCA